MGCIILPLAAGVVLILLGAYTSPRCQASVAVGASAATMAMSLLLLRETLKGGIIVHKMAGWSAPVGIILVVDGFNAFIASIIVGVVLAAAVFSIGYMRGETSLSYYYALVMLMLGGMMGVVLTGDLFNLFVFLEVMSISAYGLVAFRSYEMEPLEAGFKYLVMGGTATTIVLLGVALIYGAVGTVNLADIACRLRDGGFLPGVSGSLVLSVSLALLVTGFGLKAAIFPFHTWLPDAHPAAPSSISAILSGVVIKVGIYALFRILFIIPLNVDFAFAVAVFSVLTMTVGNVMAMFQTDIKRLLAFSSIANIGYILLALSVGFGGGAYGVYGLTSGLLHVLNHAIMKALLFLTAGAIVHAAGTRNLEELVGVGHKMKATAVILVIGVLAIAGVPPFNGFISEFSILLAALGAGMGPFAALMLANILLAFSYYLRLLYILVWQAPKESLSMIRDPSPSMILPMGVLASLCIVFGVWPQPVLALSHHAALSLLNLNGYIAASLG
ncbi:MAG: cation:proton antiporter [Candidatus Hecatellales archaeon]|nr:MAG: cation:proton antiporter [Candidatus Hecatellales archaeon]